VCARAGAQRRDADASRGVQCDLVDRLLAYGAKLQPPVSFFVRKVIFVARRAALRGESPHSHSPPGPSDGPGGSLCALVQLGGPSEVAALLGNRHDEHPFDLRYAPRNAAPRRAAPRNAAPRRAAPRNAAPRRARPPCRTRPRHSAPRSRVASPAARRARSLAVVCAAVWA
jgi:hypothetical protein